MAGTPLQISMWVKSALFGCLLFGPFFLYNLGYRSGDMIASASEATAATAGILLGCSFGLSVMSYFFNFLDTSLKYRKYLGLWGYYTALLYCVTLSLRFPQLYGAGVMMRLLELEVVLGLSAMAILTVMALVSNPVATKLLGHHWREVLRLGYVAYALLIIRAVILEGDVWWQWMMTMRGLPPPRMILSLFAWSVIMGRLILEMHLRISPKKTERMT